MADEMDEIAKREYKNTNNRLSQIHSGNVRSSVGIRALISLLIKENYILNDYKEVAIISFRCDTWAVQLFVLYFAAMEVVREKTEQLLALKVMRLTRPTLMGSIVVTNDVKDLSGDLFNDALKSEVTAVHGSETIASGQFLLLPQCFGNIYLGETFSSYICVHNDSNQIAKDVTVRAILQTEKNSITLSTEPPNSTDIVPGATVDEVIHHEVKEFGAHILVCEVSYCSGTLSSNLLTFRKFFKFEVFKPLDVKTKLYTAESDDVYLEAQVQNTTSGTLSLEKISLEPSNLFGVTKLNALDEKDPYNVNIMTSGGSKQFLYRLTPHNISTDLKLLVDSKFIGKLDIIWRSNLGERGRLQTSPLHRYSPNVGNIRLSVVQIPDIVFINEIFELTCRIINTSERSMELILVLVQNPGFAWCALSGQKMNILSPGGSSKFILKLVPLLPGLQSVSGIKLKDPEARITDEYDDIAQVFVSQRVNHSF